MKQPSSAQPSSPEKTGFAAVVGFFGTLARVSLNPRLTQARLSAALLKSATITGGAERTISDVAEAHKRQEAQLAESGAVLAQAKALRESEEKENITPSSRR